MKKIISFLVILLLLTVGGFFTTNANASSDGSLPFHIEPILPDNQDEDVAHYISITPDSNSLNQELEFSITNNTNQKQEIDVKLFNAYTSGNGGIQYTTDGSDNHIIIDEKYEMKNYLQAPEKVVLEGEESKVIQINADIPEMEGTMLGAVAFESHADSEQNESDGVSFEIKNEINTVYGVAVHFPMDQNEAFTLDKPYLDPMPNYYVVRLPITHDAPTINIGTELNYQVMHKDEELFSNQKEINFAPYTKTNIPIPFEHDEIIENETYIIKGEFIYQDDQGDETIIQFEETFTYEKNREENSIFGTLTPPVISSDFPVWTIILISVPIAFAAYLFYRKRKNLAEEN